MDPKLQKLNEMLKLLDEGLTKAEFTAAFEDVVRVVKAIQEDLIRRIDTKLSTETEQMVQQMTDLRQQVDQALIDVKKATDSTFAQLKQRSMESINATFDRMRLNERFNAMMEEHMLKMEAMDEKMESVEREGIITDVLARIPEDPEETADEIRDKLETLEGDQRLAKEAIRGIEILEGNIKELQIRPVGRGGGGKGIGLYVDGAKKLLTAQTINIVPGTGISITYANSNGRNDITISATGSGAFSILAATGTRDDSNVDFTFVSEPTLLLVNGASYQKTGGAITWTWNGGTLTATLSQPVGVSGDVYGIG